MTRQVGRRGASRARTWSFWLAGWLGLAAIGMANGAVRILGYEDRLGEPAAHQVATQLLIAAMLGYTWLLHRRRPLPSGRTAVGIGVVWMLLTLAFEFGVGHWALGRPWSVLWADYDLTAGRIWVLVPITTVIAPALVRAVQNRRQHDDAS